MNTLANALVSTGSLYLSTIDGNASALAAEYGLGLEIAEYCTAWNMDEHFEETHAQVSREIEGMDRRLFHGPFNELFPCAVDLKARALAAGRFRQAIALAKRYHSEKVVFHGGFNPWIYWPEWYVEQSVLFWKEFLREGADVPIVLENVLETDPALLMSIVREVNDERLRLCLDIGHVNAYSPASPMEWLETCAPFISHFHLHNNDGSWDTHSPLHEGSISMREFLEAAQTLCPHATYTLELTDARSSIEWLLEG